jgi:hypothetical protein
MIFAAKESLGLAKRGKGYHNLFIWLVADDWCWFVLREKYCWLVVGG